MLRNSTVLFLFFFSLTWSFANDDKGTKREKHALRVEQSPVIDGVLDDAAWQPENEKMNFIQFAPHNGKPSEFQTSVQLVYTDRAIYIAARMYDPSPDKILRELGRRDELGRNADAFGLILDPYNSGMNAFSFFISAAGVQSDFFISGSYWDRNWDAVWNSAVKIDEWGWTVEFEIPYYTIRFPKQEVQDWSVNFYRKIKRNQEETYWNHVDNSIQGIVNQGGVLKGIENIKPPLRLSFSPYVTSIYNHDGSANNNTFSLTGGMDLKYGINEGYTLDMSLIPDFSQVQSDNVILNLSAFEVQFNENRQFFTEGTELFNKGNLFYSRRVGSTFGTVDYNPETEEVISKPASANLLNAAKVTGRNKKGLGLGFFNAITDRTKAKVKNKESGEVHNVDVDPLTNFNVMVVDQNLKNNSNINFTNTNVIRADGGRDANVSGLSVALHDKTLRYRVRTFGSYSLINRSAREIANGRDITSAGFKYTAEIGKVGGIWQYGISRSVESDQYNINDLGFIRASNEVSHSGYFRYNLLQPSGILNRFNSTLSAHHGQLYSPRVFTSFDVSANAYAQFKNFWGVSMRYGLRPIQSYDYFEPRTEGYFVSIPSSGSYSVFVESDSRKPLKGNVYSGRFVRNEWDQDSDWLGVFLRYRVNDKLSLNVEVNAEDNNNGRGYVTKQADDVNDQEEIIFGERKIKTATNIAGLNYTFNNKMGVNLRVRHYWSTVRYESFYSLATDGSLNPADYNGVSPEDGPKHDTNFNALNLDFAYFMQVAPGSFLNLVWKDAISSLTNDARMNYLASYKQAMEAPHINNVSLRFTYFLDYTSLKRAASRM